MTSSIKDVKYAKLVIERCVWPFSMSMYFRAHPNQIGLRKLVLPSPRLMFSEHLNRVVTRFWKDSSRYVRL